jgi:hypothetical protein
MADASMGHQSRLSMAAAGTAIGSYTEAYEFRTEGLRAAREIVETSGIRGTRSMPIERTRDGTVRINGTIAFHATPAMLDLLLPRIMGSAEVADLFAVAETLPEFDVLIERVAKRFVYAGCKVARATFRATAGGALELDLEITGKSETVSATAFPTIAAPNDPPYIWSDAVCTVEGSARVVTRWELSIDNQLNARFSNSNTATDIHTQGRVVTVSMTVPYTSDEVDLYGINSSGASGATFVLTNGGRSITFTVGALAVADSSPGVSGPGEILLEMNGIAKSSGSTKELSITSDSTA